LRENTAPPGHLRWRQVPCGIPPVPEAKKPARDVTLAGVVSGNSVEGLSGIAKPVYYRHRQGVTALFPKHNQKPKEEDFL
jgi:hypothetical protein